MWQWRCFDTRERREKKVCENRYWKLDVVYNTTAATSPSWYTPTQIFTFCTVYNGNLHVPAKFHLDRLNGWGDIANFRFLIWRPPAILNLWNMQISTSRTVYSQNLPIYTKFHHNRLNGCGDIAIFWFPIWRLSAILNFRNMQIFTFWGVYNGICMFLQNFVSIGRTVADISPLFAFKYVGRPPFWIFEICKFSLSARFTMVICMFLQNFVLIGWTVAELLHIKYFQYGGRPPSLIFYRMRGTTHDAALVVRRSPENFVQIGWIAFEI